MASLVFICYWSQVAGHGRVGTGLCSESSSWPADARTHGGCGISMAHLASTVAHMICSPPRPLFAGCLAHVRRYLPIYSDHSDSPLCPPVCVQEDGAGCRMLMSSSDDDEEEVPLTPRINGRRVEQPPRRTQEQRTQGQRGEDQTTGQCKISSVSTIISLYMYVCIIIIILIYIIFGSSWAHLFCEAVYACDTSPWRRTYVVNCKMKGHNSVLFSVA
jgi:hypothetical protein